MKNWKKTSLLTALVLGLLIVGIFYLFNLKVVSSSGDIEFSPGLEPKGTTIDSVDNTPRNIIIFVADGLGFTHLSLAMLTQQKENKTSVWQQFDVKSWHDTRSTFGPLTDSGASATAMATGTSTFFEVIGQDAEGNHLTNVFELANAQQYNTAIVTDSYIWDATPAAFVAHTGSRDNAREILTQIAASELDLLFGELEDLGEDEIPDLETTIEILKQRFQLLDATLTLPQQTEVLAPIAAIFEEDEIQDMTSTPNLLQLTDAALRYLSYRDSPFILLVECEEMDSASHRNDSKRVLKGIAALQETLSLVLDYAKTQGETLVVFTSDHETGGLAAVSDSNYPNLQLVWATKNHTASVVPLFAMGPGAETFLDVKRNSDIGQRLKILISTSKGLSE
ncbi:alkaline phosphatase [Muriicola sp. Z0-33]|uniref:alkaline phosphatase n=1 Tax=Muriicola sp. Z0-33 TaxID=2816957 RepID=UPI00223809B2|nr:alkaline phosphatase [Muriicola sp. Z0-33]MCW5517122.1 alkaline phosphatase [Muriicola sp. Z0-33]